MIEVTRRLQRVSDSHIHSGGRTRAVIVELSPDRPGLIGFRLKGTRRTYYLPIDACYRDAVRCELARQKAERKKEREARKKA